MAREHIDYRPTMEELNRKFPDKFLLTKRDVSSFLGVCEKTVARKYPLPKGETHYTKPMIARLLANG